MWTGDEGFIFPSPYKTLWVQYLRSVTCNHGILDPSPAMHRWGVLLAKAKVHSQTTTIHMIVRAFVKAAPFGVMCLGVKHKNKMKENHESMTLTLTVHAGGRGRVALPYG